MPLWEPLISLTGMVVSFDKGQKLTVDVECVGMWKLAQLCRSSDVLGYIYVCLPGTILIFEVLGGEDLYLPITGGIHLSTGQNKLLISRIKTTLKSRKVEVPNNLFLSLFRGQHFGWSALHCTRMCAIQQVRRRNFRRCFRFKTTKFISFLSLLVMGTCSLSDAVVVTITVCSTIHI